MALLILGMGHYGCSQRFARGAVQHTRTVESSACSRKNLAEAVCAGELALSLTELAGPGSVGILSWYNARVASISESCKCAQVHVGSIATSQGSE